MRILVTHGWIRGNLGDFCITKQCLKVIRGEIPGARIDLVSVPAENKALNSEISRSVDRFMEKSPYEDLSALFKNYDAVINAPGGGLQTPSEKRGVFMLRDAAFCREMKIPHFFSGHSFHPFFDSAAIEQSFFFSREPATHDFLQSRGLSRILSSADPAFLETMPALNSENTRSFKTLLFLRFDHFRQVERAGRTLRLDGREVVIPEGELVLATSDMRQDEERLKKLSRQWGVPYRPSPDLEHLLQTIREASCVISDRYHPVIFSKIMGIPCTFLQREGSLRDAGLQRLLEEKTPEECAASARQGLLDLCRILKVSVEKGLDALETENLKECGK